MALTIVILTVSCRRSKDFSETTAKDSTIMTENDLPHTDAEWRDRLTPEQYRVLRRKGTEPAFSGVYAHEKTPGTYVCAGCGEPLFESSDKYDSGSGWPSFTRPVDESQVHLEEDSSLLPVRTEVLCARCGGHLGHVFPDGPPPTGTRYCLNSVSLKLQPRE